MQALYVLSNLIIKCSMDGLTDVHRYYIPVADSPGSPFPLGEGVEGSPGIPQHGHIGSVIKCHLFDLSEAKIRECNTWSEKCTVIRRSCVFCSIL